MIVLKNKHYYADSGSWKYFDVQSKLESLS